MLINYITIIAIIPLSSIYITKSGNGLASVKYNNVHTEKIIKLVN